MVGRRVGLRGVICRRVYSVSAILDYCHWDGCVGIVVNCEVVRRRSSG
jgi:hypothetical protein